MENTEYPEKKIVFKNKLWNFKIKTYHCFLMQKWLSKLADYFEKVWCEVTSYAQVPDNHQAVKRELYVHLSHLSQPVSYFSCFSLVCCTCFLLPSPPISLSLILSPYLTSIFPASVYFLLFLLPLDLIWLSYLYPYLYNEEIPPLKLNFWDPYLSKRVLSKILFLKKT